MALDTLRPAALQTREAAKYLGLSVSTLRKWRMRGPDDPGERGPPYRKTTPTMVLYRVEDLDAWLAKREVAA